MVARPGFAGCEVVVYDRLAAAGKLDEPLFDEGGKALALIGIALKELLYDSGLLYLIDHAVFLGEVHVFEDLYLLKIRVRAHYVACRRVARVIGEAAQPRGVHMVLGDKIQSLHDRLPEGLRYRKVRRR